jgi:MazG family protein
MAARMARRRARNESVQSTRLPITRTHGKAARAGEAFARLVEVMATLRSPAGCPWDRRQTHRSLRPYLLEETYEALDAIERRDFESLRGELGDVLFQVVFHAEVASASGRFTADDVIREVIEKLIRRHPHVFAPDGTPLGRSSVRSPKTVLEQWEQIKAKERSDQRAPAGLLAHVPRSLPALLRAHKISKRAATVGFDWPDAGAVIDKIDEEVRELREALAQGRARTIEELGDLFFAMANLARKLGVEPEAALTAANDKFTKRFHAVERLLARQGRNVHEASAEELDAAWTAVKQASATRPSSRRVRASIGRGRRGHRSR